MKKIELFYVNAGGGHRSAAIALEMSIREQYPDWHIRLVNLFEVLDPQDVFRRTTGVKPEDYYNVRLARGWTLGLAQELRILQVLIRMSHKSLLSQLKRHWRETRPDLVVSLIPNFNRAMHQALALVCPQAPYVTILTDFADFPPHFWIEPRQSQHLICGTPRARAQAHAAGFDHSHVHETSGMIISPNFYRDLKLERRAECLKLGLDPDRAIGLVMFGGHGSRSMRGIATRLNDTQLILACGHNAVLAEELRGMRASAPRAIVGFTSQMSYYMSLSDFFIGKPGPGSISEAIQQGLPVIVVRNAWTMPQERYNTQWVEENGAGVVLDSFKMIRSGVAQVTQHIELYRANVRSIRNRAVFEIPQILESILMTPGRVGVDLIQHLRTAERVHLS
jgi:Glycosyltransferase family 28 C-terminal domain/Monogalactosyldiacylglycerol (MGDG) synthase